MKSLTFLWVPNVDFLHIGVNYLNSCGSLAVTLSNKTQIRYRFTIDITIYTITILKIINNASTLELHILLLNVVFRH